MKKETLLIGGVCLVAGLLVVFVLMRGGDKSAPPAASVPPAAAPGTATPPASNMPEIQVLKKMVADDPQNHDAWVLLGNLYFDSEQPVKAVDAYDQALKLDPDDPDVLTDQGVMFRRLGWFDRAVDNFSKANTIDPSHATSLFNLGIVYRFDLQDYDKAKDAWTRYLALTPPGPNAEQARKDLEFLKTHPPVPQQK